MNRTASKLATLLGTASLLTLTKCAFRWRRKLAAGCPQGKWHGGAASSAGAGARHGLADSRNGRRGVPITTLSAEDYKQVGALTTADLLKSVPSVYVLAGYSHVTTGGNL